LLCLGAVIRFVWLLSSLFVCLFGCEHARKRGKAERPVEGATSSMLSWSTKQRSTQLPRQYE
jgi:hypothetical protein